MKCKGYVRWLDLVTAGGYYVKRMKNLITPEKITLEFCKQCIREASVGKANRHNVKVVLDNIDEYAEKLQDMVLNETFEPSKCISITKVEYGKVRNIEKPEFFPDQAVHHLLINLIYDRIIKRIDPYAIASIKNRGIHCGVRAVTRWLVDKNAYKSCKYVIKGDIKQCFASIKPEVIYDMYEKLIKDKKYLALKRKVLFQHKSLPLGNYCSSFDLNLLLLPLDQMIREKSYTTHYIRYMDDFVIFCVNRRKAFVLKDEIKACLAKFGLELKNNYSMHKTSIFGIDFIGYRFFSGNTILRKRNFLKITRLARRLGKARHYALHDCRSLVSLLGLCSHCHSTKVVRFVMKTVNYKLVKNIIRGAGKCNSNC